MTSLERAINAMPKNRCSDLWAMTHRKTGTPLQPQSERSKRRRQWVGPHENHAGVKFPWSCADSRLTCLFNMDKSKTFY